MGDTLIGTGEVLTFGQIEALWIAEGGSSKWAPTMAGIAEAESGGQTNVLNNTPSTDDYSVGLWQINYFGDLLPGRTASYGSPDALAASPAAQAKAAVDLLGGGAGITNWRNDTVGQPTINAGGPLSYAAILALVTHSGHATTDAADTTNMSLATLTAWMSKITGQDYTAGGITPLPPTVVETWANNNLNKGAGAVSTITQGATDAAGLIGDLTNPSVWKTGGEYVLALLLVIFGSILFFKSTATGQRVEGAATSAATAAAV